MPSPPRQPGGSPPWRAALHERSESQTNRNPPPSLRIVGNPEASIYESDPYPTKPSQVLRPPRLNRGQASALENVPSVSSQHPRYLRGPSNTPPPRRKENPSSSAENEGQSAQGFYADVSTYMTSLEDDLVEEAGSRGNKNIKPLASVGGHVTENTERGRVSGDSVVQLPDVPPRAEGHVYTPPSTPHDPNVPRQPANKESDSSLSSTNTTGTVVVKKTRDGKRRASYTAFPFSRPSSSKSNLTIATPPRLTPRSTDESDAPRSPVSPSSPVSEAYAPPRKSRSSSLPMESSPKSARQKPAAIQYPVIRPQSVSASWAESSSGTPQAQPATARNQDRWNPHLSTVPSEGSNSWSGGRSSLSTALRDSSRASKSSSNILSSTRISTDFPPVPRRSSDLSPNSMQDSSPRTTNNFSLPFPLVPRQREFSGSTIRMVNDRDEFSAPQQGRSRDASGGTIRMVNENQPGMPEVESHQPPLQQSVPSNSTIIPRSHPRHARPKAGSRSSFFRDSIPAWARAYYGRPNSSVSDIRPNSRRVSTSTDNISLNVFRSLPLTKNGKPRELRRSRMRIGQAPPQLDFAGIRDSPRRRYSLTWSPHLLHDRSSMYKRRTVFIPPSLDERAEGSTMNRRNGQILCFVLGFIFPPAWFFGSFLPLPHRASLGSTKGKGTTHESQIIEDLENELGPLDESRYENARWWRNINRMLSIAGLLIMAAIIALAVVGAT